MINSVIHPYEVIIEMNMKWEKEVIKSVETNMLYY